MATHYTRTRDDATHHSPTHRQGQGRPVDQERRVSVTRTEALTKGISMSYPLLETIKSPADVKRLSIPELEKLASDIRHAICDQVSKTGGHLAPNLGVVELTLAMHYVFDFGHDRLLFDVGHQCYPHKLVTGRAPMLGKLRQKDGLAGFPEPRESAYDLFSVGHAGTGISTAVGMARGDTLMGQGDRKVVCIVGDSSIVNGLSMEGINNAGTLNRQLLIVLNDNGMSIGQPQGALAGYFDKFRLNPSYKQFKDRAHEMLKHIPGGPTIEEIYHRLGEATKAVISHDHFYEHFGLLCVGPIDGHDLPTLIEMFQEAKEINRPVLLHAKTIKGKGFEFSEGDATTFHSPKPFRVEGCRVELQSSGRSFTSAFADLMTEVMTKDEKVTVVTAGMPDGTGVVKLIKDFPDRAFDVGIAESHAMDMMAGMAKAGLKPFVAVYSTFMQRAFDQVFQEVTLQGLPVRICMDRAGLVGGDGAVHHGFSDISFLRIFPKMAVLAPMDEPTFKLGLEFMRTYDDGASAIRYPRDSVPTPAFNDNPPAFELGKAHKLVDGDDLAILAYGFPANHALKAREELAQQGYNVAVYDARFAKPVDIELIKSLVDAGTPILTVEDHGLQGGFGSAVLEACNDARVNSSNIHRIGLPDGWIYQGSRSGQLAECGIDATGIARKVREILDDTAAAGASSDATNSTIRATH
ncbi:MAG: 1-deoxy-D-xylulose-5-phosphate synthase [Phycisphaera sp.]|nr:1-deoxy-D-xylulose-5-phosphate synthase [Phycisphaera sp.]